MIAIDVFRRLKRRRGFTTYQQLVLGISVFDSISSLAYMLVGVMAPVDAGFYLSRGNDITCKAQAFMIQLGQTSMYYNLCLAVYFWLVICRNWKEYMLQKLLRWTHAGVIALGVGMAVGALPYTGPGFGVCSMLPPPATGTFWPVSLFFTLPICVVLLVLGATTLAICRKVYVQQRKAQRWMFEHSLRLTRSVFRQSFYYVVGFYTTLPFLLLTYYLAVASMNIWIFLAVAVFAPGQGIVNAMIYFKRTRGNAIFFAPTRRPSTSLAGTAQGRNGSSRVRSEPLGLDMERIDVNTEVPMVDAGTAATNKEEVSAKEDASRDETALDKTDSSMTGFHARADISSIPAQAGIAEEIEPDLSEDSVDEEPDRLPQPLKRRLSSWQMDSGAFPFAAVMEHLRIHGELDNDTTNHERQLFDGKPSGFFSRFFA